MLINGHLKLSNPQNMLLLGLMKQNISEKRRDILMMKNLERQRLMLYGIIQYKINGIMVI